MSRFDQLYRVSRPTPVQPPSHVVITLSLVLLSLSAWKSSTELHSPINVKQSPSSSLSSSSCVLRYPHPLTTTTTSYSDLQITFASSPLDSPRELFSFHGSQTTAPDLSTIPIPISPLIVGENINSKLPCPNCGVHKSLISGTHSSTRWNCPEKGDTEEIKTTEQVTEGIQFHLRGCGEWKHAPVAIILFCFNCICGVRESPPINKNN